MKATATKRNIATVPLDINTWGDGWIETPGGMVRKDDIGIYDDHHDVYLEIPWDENTTIVLKRSTDSFVCVESALPSIVRTGLCAEDKKLYDPTRYTPTENRCILAAFCGFFGGEDYLKSVFAFRDTARLTS